MTFWGKFRASDLSIGRGFPQLDTHGLSPTWLAAYSTPGGRCLSPPTLAIPKLSCAHRRDLIFDSHPVPAKCNQKWTNLSADYADGKTYSAKSAKNCTQIPLTSAPPRLRFRLCSTVLKTPLKTPYPRSFFLPPNEGYYKPMPVGDISRASLLERPNGGVVFWCWR